MFLQTQDKTITINVNNFDLCFLLINIKWLKGIKRIRLGHVRHYSLV